MRGGEGGGGGGGRVWGTRPPAPPRPRALPPPPLSGDGNVNGFGLEFYIEAPAGELPGSVHDAKASWQFQLLYTVSQLAAGHGGIRAIMDDMRLLSTEAEGVAAALPPGAAAAHVNSAGRVGALLGLKSRPGDPDGACEGVWRRVRRSRAPLRGPKPSPTPFNHPLLFL